MGYIYKNSFGLRLYAMDGVGNNWTSKISEAHRFTEQEYSWWDQDKYHFEPC